MAEMDPRTPIVLARRDGGVSATVVLVPLPDGLCDALTFRPGERTAHAEGDLDEILARLSAEGFSVDDGIVLPPRQEGAVRVLVEANDTRPTPYHHGPTWSAHAAKRCRAGTERRPARASEKAWVRRAWPDSTGRPGRERHAFLDSVRFMRWYAHRSDLDRKIVDRPYDPWLPAFYARWPRWTP